MGAVPGDEEALIRRWFADTFGDVDPSAVVERHERGRAWRPTTGRDGRSTTQERVFILLQILLEEHRLSIADLDQIARFTVIVARCSPASVAGLLERWGLPPDQLAHVAHVMTRVALED